MVTRSALTFATWFIARAVNPALFVEGAVETHPGGGVADLRQTNARIGSAIDSDGHVDPNVDAHIQVRRGRHACLVEAFFTQETV